MDAIKVDMAMLAVLKGYNTAHHQATWVIYTPTDSKFGGVSSEFIEFIDPETVCLKKANGDTYLASLSLLTITVKY